ncbi:galactose mutarotase-like domain-containing protein [Geopyxis carbonaria]|nr:galactose mutarotase-like domain-containing protein [Geopyxis carbonaria]
MKASLFLWSALTAVAAAAGVNVTQTTSSIHLSNDRLSATFSKTKNGVVALELDGQDLLGASGYGPYLDCYCVPSGFYTVGSQKPVWEVVAADDGAWAGVVLSDTYAATNQTFQQYWFLRETETGLHMFSRVAYYNTAVPFLRNLQELRTLFRPAAGGLWTHLATNDEQAAPLPSVDAVAAQTVVQDATWSLANTPDDPYVQEFSDYFTKYTFSNDWRNTFAHGMYADGRATNGTTYGAFLVMNSKDTYYGGPLHSDLTVDGIVYNYLVSNHHGEGTPNITHGFDRTFGPQYYHFTSSPTGASLQTLRGEAEALAKNPTWNVDFYDAIAPHVTGYTPSSGRGTFTAKVSLPKGAKQPIAVLSASGRSFQDNAERPSAKQYWADISASGTVTIPRVAAGTYRLTLYASGIFGDFTRDALTITPQHTTSTSIVWHEQSAGNELWRLGTPDKSSGEFRRGDARDAAHPRHPRQHWIFWGAYDFAADFPAGVNYTIGASDAATDWNTVHWSVFAPPRSAAAPASGPAVSDWRLHFTVPAAALRHKRTATFTIQLAGAKTAAGNTDIFNATEPYADLPLRTVVNGEGTVEMVVPWYKSSSCIVRSAVSCYQVAERMTFPASWLRVGGNEFVISLPEGAVDYESAVLPAGVYVQYDALRLEVE